MAQAQRGDTVRVHYTGKFNDGEVFDTSGGGDPLEFELGSNQVIQGFEEAIVGMCPGESKNHHIPVEKAYGPRREELVIAVERDKFPPQMELEIGQVLQLQSDEGNAIQALVTELAEASVTLDANHPLAGQDLTFDIQLVGIA